MIAIVILLILMRGPNGSAYPLPPSPPSQFLEQPTQTDEAPMIGFDCNQTEPEILSLSSLEVGPCPEMSELRPKVETVYGQIIQKHLIDKVHIRTCQVTRTTSYFRCGGSSGNYNVYPPAIQIIQNLKPDICSRIHLTGEFFWSNTRSPHTGLEPNNTYQMSSNEVGWTDRYGNCEGGYYVIAGVEHMNVVVQTALTVSIRESWGTYDRESGHLNIENSAQCKYAPGSCSDALTGVHVWTPDNEKCSDNSYVQLYKGPINITRSSEEGVVMMTVQKMPFIFAAELGTKVYTCALSMQLTEFPDVYYVPQVDKQYQGKFKETTTLDIQFITYLNAKMTFAYHDAIGLAQDFYLQSLRRTCEVERDMLKNRIEIIRLNSQSGGLSSLLKPGMFAKVNGEIIHLIKCEPVPVQLRNTPDCHAALPIKYRGMDVFLLPNTHIISEYSSLIPCTPVTPVTYKIGGRWWSFTGHFTPVSPPQLINPKGIEKMGFTKIRSFSKGGMYAIEQIEAVQKLLTFPNLREAVSTNIAAGITNYYGRPIKMDLTSIMSDADWETVAQKHLSKWWGWFASIGNAVSGIIGFYFVYRLCKGVLNCLLDAKELYSMFGWSFRLFAACWSRLALYFLNQARARSTSSQTSLDGSQSNNPPPAENPDHTQNEEEEEMIPLALYPAPLIAPTAPLRRSPLHLK